VTTYLITGCGRGVGLAMTNALLARGDRVIGSVRGGQSPVAHSNFRQLTFDVRDDAAVTAAADDVDEAIDVLINNAGIMGPRTDSALEMDFVGFAEVLAVNVLGPLRVTHAFLPHLRRGKASKVMAISSQLGSMSYPGSDRIAYRTSKAALNKMMQGLALDLTKEGIAVVVVHPGWVRTDMGGVSADLEVTDSATGIIGVLDALTIATTGRFLNWDGTERPW
jgi:NAD(P)-dependent dehydrogenase (short-subunit alcohol dehydrogenase family)